MTFDFLDRRSAERFAELIDEQPGTRRHSAGDLAELVAIGHTLSAAPPKVHVDPEFRTGLRAMLLAAAERDGIGSTATAVAEPGAHAAVREPRPGLLRAGSARRIRVRGAIVISVAAGAMAVSGISAASEGAAPGDALYGVKRSTERAQLAIAGSDLTRGQLSLDFARTRLAEAAAMPGGDSAFAGVLNDMDSDTRQGVRLLTSAAVSRKDASALSGVENFATGQRASFAPIIGTLGAHNRERAAASLALLDTIHQRSEALKAALACPKVTPVGTDELGPQLAECTDGKGQDSTSDRPQISGQRQGSKAIGHDNPADPGRAHPTGKPKATTTAVPHVHPGGVAPSSAGPSPSPTGAPVDGYDSGYDDGNLNGYLGGLLSN